MLFYYRHRNFISCGILIVLLFAKTGLLAQKSSIPPKGKIVPVEVYWLSGNNEFKHKLHIKHFRIVNDKLYYLGVESKCHTTVSLYGMVLLIDTSGEVIYAHGSIDEPVEIAGQASPGFSEGVNLGLHMKMPFTLTKKAIVFIHSAKIDEDDRD